MALWRFMEYYSPAGNNLIEEWYLGLSEAAQAEFDVTLKTLAITENWRGMAEFKHLGKDGLCEIRFSADNIQYRPAGFFGPGARVFSIYVGCHKKGKIYYPPEAFDLAAKRRRKVENGEASLNERTV
ncbi:MAG: type II toxin-antitoxin system RelE/ParE family toxin [Acidobacteriaceae bacterium]|nr:type II toxin-antitoxin system RelE/ParE family toxin [Acidobacteriaceae bacterium]